jgi:hypothetical protein
VRAFLREFISLFKTAFLVLILIFGSCFCFATDIEGSEIKGEPCAFSEVWGYVMEGLENEFDAKSPITDVGYFSATVNTYGELVGVPKRSKIPSSYKGRVHLVTSCDGRSLSHFAISPDFPLREKLISDLVREAEGFDGLQIDYEYIPGRDAQNFLTFLEEIRKRLPRGKIFSVAVPARMRTISDDIYHYPKIAALCDRVFIMAYDEHWSTSAPGSIASMDWCKKIASYAKTVIPAEKLVIGLPSYGRTWGRTWNRAFYHSGVKRIWRENGKPEIKRTKGIPHFSFTVPVSVTCYYEDDYSLVERCRMYEQMGIGKIGFWRVGFEESSFWKWIKIVPERKSLVRAIFHQTKREGQGNFDFVLALQTLR